VEELIEFHGPDTVAAVVGEPIASYLGAIVPGPDYWPMLREICDRYGVLLIADEVLTGFGRTGKMFALEHWDVVPDLMTFAKGVTSGYFPLGGVIARREIADVFTGSEKAMFKHVLTYGGQPAACAAALKNLEILESEHLIENSASMGEYLVDGLFEMQHKHPIMGDVQGKGLLVGVELVKDRSSKEQWPADANLADRVAQLYKENGILLPMSSGVIRIAPPLCITRSEIDEILRVTDNVLLQVERELGVTQ
jgi:putrescine aminotransferase